MFVSDMGHPVKRVCVFFKLLIGGDFIFTIFTKAHAFGEVDKFYFLPASLALKWVAHINASKFAID